MFSLICLQEKNNTSHAIVTWPHPKHLRLFFMIRCKTNVWYNGPSGTQNQGLWIIWGVWYIVCVLILSKLSSMKYHAQVNKWTDMITKNSPWRKKSIFSFFDCLKKNATFIRWILTQMACSLKAQSHYQNQCWLFINGIRWCSTQNKFTRSAHQLYP